MSGLEEYYCATHGVTGEDEVCWIGGESRRQMEISALLYRQRLGRLIISDPTLKITDMYRSYGNSNFIAVGPQPLITDLLGDENTDQPKPHPEEATTKF